MVRYITRGSRGTFQHQTDMSRRLRFGVSEYAERASFISRYGFKHVSNTRLAYISTLKEEKRKGLSVKNVHTKVITAWPNATSPADHPTRSGSNWPRA